MLHRIVPHRSAILIPDDLLHLVEQFLRHQRRPRRLSEVLPAVQAAPLVADVPQDVRQVVVAPLLSRRPLAPRLEVLEDRVLGLAAGDPLEDLQHDRSLFGVWVLLDEVAAVGVVAAGVPVEQAPVGEALLGLCAGGAEYPVADALGFVFGGYGVLCGRLAVFSLGEVEDLAVVAEEDVGVHAGVAEADVGLDVAVVAARFPGDDDAAFAGFDGGEEGFEVAAGAAGVAGGGAVDVLVEDFDDGPAVLVAEVAAFVDLVGDGAAFLFGVAGGAAVEEGGEGAWVDEVEVFGREGHGPTIATHLPGPQCQVRMLTRGVGDG